MDKKFKAKWFYAALGTCKVKSGLATQKAQRQYTQRRVNFDAFATMLAEKYNEFDKEGYDVVNVVPIAMGQSETCQQRSGAYVGDVGFSITRGAVVVGRRRDETSPDEETGNICEEPPAAEDHYADGDESGGDDASEDGDSSANG